MYSNSKECARRRGVRFDLLFDFTIPSDPADCRTLVKEDIKLEVGAENMLNQRHLWNVLSGVEATPDDYIGHLIETAKPQLITVLEKSKFDSLTVESGRSKLQKDGTSDLALAFIQRLAEHLNISLLSASDVFGSYLLSNFISADECIAKLEGDVRRKKTLIDQVAEFYRLEQLYSIRCLIELIKNSDREEASFVKEAVFFGKILAHVEAVITGSAFPTFGSSNATDEALSVWAAHCAQLQMLLFELILWHLHLLPHSAADCISVIKLFKKYEHGRKQPMRRYNAAGFDLATPSISQLQTLSVLRCFDMDALVAQSLVDSDIARFVALQRILYIIRIAVLYQRIQCAIRKQRSTERHTWSAASDWNALETELGTWSRSSELSPILLAWAVMLKLLDRPDQDVKVQKLGALARKFDACAWLRSGIEDSLIKNNPDLKRLSMTIVYCLLDAFLCCFEADSLCPADSLNGILATLLCDASLADDVWSRNFSSGVSRHIRDTLYRFPCYFDGPVELLTSLCRASSSSAQKAVTLLQRLPYYAESAVTAASDLEDAGTDDDGLYRSTQTRHMPDGTVIPARTIGQVIDDAAGQLIQWRLYTNGWQICLSEAKRQNANIVLDLVTAAIKSDVSQTDKFAHLLNVAVEIYERDDSHSSIANMSACMRCFAAVAASHCAEMLNELEQAQVLPHATPGNDAVDGGAVGRLLVANEVPSNTFDHTVAFLEFVHSCTTSVDVRDHPAFVGCVLFVLRSVFPVYHQWEYADPNQKDLIGNLSLQVIHSLVQRKESGLSDASAACINELMCGEARSTLILLSTVGADVLDYLAKNSAPSVSTEAAKTVVRALSVLSQLLDQPNSNDTPLIADLFVSNVELTRQPVGLIASYLSFAADGRLAKLALVVLRKLATLCPGTMLSCLGTRASSVASAFISRLESPLEDVQLKVYLLDALTACVESQPALAELLLGVDAPEDGSCLVTVQQLLTVAQQPPQLLLAVYRLLLTLWQRRHRTALDKLRQDRNLWPIVCAPLAAGEDQFFLKIVSLVMRVMAEELHGDKHSPLIKTVNDAKLLNADRLALIYDKLSALLVSNVDLEQKKQVLTGVAELAGVLAADNSLKIVDASGRSQWVVLQSDLLARFAEHYSNEREFPIVASVGCVLLSVASAWGNDLKEDTWATVVDNFSSAWTLLLRSLPSYLVPKAVEFLVPVLNEAIKHADLMLTNDRWASAMFVLCETMEQLFVLHFGNSALQQRENSAQHCSALLHKATKVSVCVLKEMAGRSSVERRREVVLQQPICRSLVALLERQLANRALDGHFCALTADFIAVVLDVDSVQGLKVVESSNFLALVCIDLVTQLPSNSTLSPVQHTLLQRLFFVHSTGLVTLKHSFLHHALNFVGSYEQHIIHLLSSCVDRPEDSMSLVTTRRCVEFLTHLSTFQHHWRSDMPQCYAHLMQSMSACTAALIDTLSNPSLLEFQLRQRFSSEADASMLASDGGSVDRVMEVQKALIELLHLSLTFFRRFSPNLAQASNDEAFDPESYEPLLELEYNTSGSGESARMLSFGSLLRCVHLCISALRKLDTHSRTSTASPSAQRSLSFPVIADRTVMAMILEASIELVLAQTVHRLRHPRVAQADKDVLRREVATELGELMSRCQRYAGGSPSAQRRGSSTRMSPAASTAFDAQFIKFAQQFVQDLAHVS